MLFKMSILYKFTFVQEMWPGTDLDFVFLTGDGARFQLVAWTLPKEVELALWEVSKVNLTLHQKLSLLKQDSMYGPGIHFVLNT